MTRRIEFKEAFTLIDIILNDCKVQSQYLQENQDVKWDVYDHDNWDNMVENLDVIKESIRLELSSINENNTETTREYGKEL